MQRQRAQVLEFVAAHVDAIVLSPVVVTGWTETLQKVRDAGIPVFLADRAVNSDPSLFVAIAADFNLEGRLAGAWLARPRLALRHRELQGSAGSEPTIQRHKGFLAVISQFPNMRICARWGDFTNEGGRQAMESLIHSTDGLKDVCAVWSHNDNMLLGAIAAMHAAGLHPGRDQLMVSVDGVPRYFQGHAGGRRRHVGGTEIRHRKIHIRRSPGIFGGRRDYPKWVLIPSALHTPADAAAALAKRGL